MAQPQWPWPAGGLGLKLLSTYKMVLVSLCHGNCDRGTWLGMVLRFWDATYSSREHRCGVLLHLLCRAVVAGWVHVTAPVSRQKRVFLSDWLHCSSHKMLCAHTPFMEDDNSLLRCFNSALKASF